MAVQIDFDSAKIDVNRAGATPGVHFTSTAALFHLTSGFIAGMTPSNWSPAFRMTGQVKVTHGPGELSNWTFRFIQICRVNYIGIFYAGHRKDHGSIVLLAHKRPAFAASKVLLDSIASFDPWTNDGANFNSGGMVTNFTSDHPSLACALGLTNAKTGERNFLFQVLEDRQFWTMYTVEDPSGKRIHLAHVYWQARHNMGFKWRGGRPTSTGAIAGASSRLFFDFSKSGAPKDKDLQGLLADPKSPYHNIVADAAIKATVLGGPPNRVTLDTWHPDVPKDFFR